MTSLNDSFIEEVFFLLCNNRHWCLDIDLAYNLTSHSVEKPNHKISYFRLSLTFYHFLSQHIGKII